MFPHGWDGSTYVPFSADSDGSTVSTVQGEDVGGTKRKLLVDTDGALQVDCYGEDATLTKKKLKTNAAGELVVQTSGSVPSETQFRREATDAFGRLRTSNNFTVFNSKQINDNQPILWDTALTGTGNAVWSATEASTVLTVAAAGDAAVRQTYRRMNYQPGKSQLIFLTGIIRNPGTYSTGLTSRIGQYGSTAGLFFEYDETVGMSTGIRKNSSDILTPQASWNIDPMDGTGPSGITVDVTLPQIFVINFEWLAVGSVWYGFVINGALYWAHRNDNSNLGSSVYMQTPNNPVRYELVSTTGTTGGMTQICCSVISEGGADPSGNTFATGLTTEISLSVGNPNPEQILMAFTYKNATVAQTEIDLVASSIVANTTNDVFALIVRIVRDPATQLRNAADTGPPTLSYSSIQDSALQVARPADSFVVTDNFLGTSGYILEMFVVQSRNTTAVPIRNTIKLGWSLAGASDILVISAFPYDSCSVTTSFSWTEL